MLWLSHEGCSESVAWLCWERGRGSFGKLWSARLGGARPQADLPWLSASSLSATIPLSVLAGAGGKTDGRRLETETHQRWMAPAPSSCTHSFPCTGRALMERFRCCQPLSWPAPPAHTGLGLSVTCDTCPSRVTVENGSRSILFLGMVLSPPLPPTAGRCSHCILTPSPVKPWRTDPPTTCIILKITEKPCEHQDPTALIRPTKD